MKTTNVNMVYIQVNKCARPFYASRYTMMNTLAFQPVGTL